MNNSPLDKENDLNDVSYNYINFYTKYIILKIFLKYLIHIYIFLYNLFKLGK